MIDVAEIERLTKKFSESLQAVTGCKPDIDVWFHTQAGDTRSLAHDAVNCGYRVKRIRDSNNRSIVSHISVLRDVPNTGTIYIHVNPRKERRNDRTS